MRISDWSSDVCSSDLVVAQAQAQARDHAEQLGARFGLARQFDVAALHARIEQLPHVQRYALGRAGGVLEQADDEVLQRLRARAFLHELPRLPQHRSEEHTSELQSLMRNSYAVFCLKKKKK